MEEKWEKALNEVDTKNFIRKLQNDTLYCKSGH